MLERYFTSEELNDSLRFLVAEQEETIDTVWTVWLEGGTPDDWWRPVGYKHTEGSIFPDNIRFFVANKVLLPMPTIRLPYLTPRHAHSLSVSSTIP